MKKNIKVLGLSLCATLLLAGCSCKKTDDSSVKANINNGSNNIVTGLTEGTKSVKLQELYDDLKAQYGNETAAKELVKMVADSIKSDAKWAARYEEKMQEKLMNLTKDSAYFVDGVFDEETLVATLNAQEYDVTCENNVYGPTYVDGQIDKYMVCNYANYKEKALELEVLTELLNEKYIYDKVFVDKANLLTTKKARLVEYVAISSGEDYSFDFLTEAVNKLAAENSEVDLEDISKLWEDKLVEKLMEKYNKINTKDDANGSIMQEFTGNHEYSKEEGLADKKKTIYDGTYYDKLVITSDKSDILNTTLVERILSENVLETNAEKTIKINGSYYLVSPLAVGSTVDAEDIRITDTTNSKYYLIKVDVINNESNEDLIYDAVKVLATNSSLVSDSFKYYLEQVKDNVSVHDEEVYAYLKAQYADIFVD